MSTKLPAGWEFAQLQNVVEYKKGKKPKYLTQEPTDGYIPYIDIKAFEKKEINRYADPSSSNLASEKDILVVWDGARSGLAGLGMAGAIGSTILALKPLGINPKYLFRYLQTQYEHINSNPRGTGIPHVDPEIFWSIQIPLAPLNEQRRIVAKLDELLAKVDACKARLDKIPAILKRFRQSVLAAACSGRLTADWRKQNPEVEPANELLKKVWKDRDDWYESKHSATNLKENSKRRNPSTYSDSIEETELPDVPNRWAWERLVNISDVRGGVTKGRNFGNRKTIFLPYLRVANVQDGFLDLSEIKEIEVLPEELDKYILKDGDLLFTEGGDRDKLGRGTVWRNSIKNCIHQNHIFRARLYSPNILPDYISLATKSDYSKSYFFQNANQTVNLASINLTTLGKVPIAIPPKAEQEEIVRRVGALFKLIDQIEKRYQNAKAHVDKLTQSILAQAFRGEQVPQDPHDEPAAKLLERIWAEREEQERITNKRNVTPANARVSAKRA